MTNSVEAEIKRVGIIVIQSLLKGDKKTGEEVYSLFIKDKTSEYAEFFSEFHDVVNKDEFLKCLRIIDANYEGGTILTLHLETHGDENGICLSSGDVVSWKEFQDAIRPLNVKMCNLLVVVMAMCYGGAIMTYLDPHDRAPFLCFVGSTRKESVHNISRGFKEFYSIYTSALDIDEAMCHLCNETNDEKRVSHFCCLKSSYIFDEVMNPDRDSSAFRQIASDIYVQERMRGRECTKAEIEEEMRRKMMQDVRECRDYYTFVDVYTQ